MRSAVGSLLTRLGIEPVLVDVGASVSAPRSWQGLAAHSTYLGFDPDRRRFQTSPTGRFKREILVDRAVVADPDAEEVSLYLTKAPGCSSTLQPNSELLRHYEFQGFFDVVGEIMVGATTLDAVLDQHGLSCIDWIKLDSQGTDLRILNSLRGDLRRKVLAVDVEPGLMSAYVGEDVFVDVHRRLVSEGFWLAKMKLGGRARITNSSMDEASTAMRLDRTILSRVLKRSPCWCGANYLRTVDWLETNGAGVREYVLLWIFSLLQDVLGFALDVALAYETRYGSGATSTAMRNATIARIKMSHRRGRRERLADLFGRIIRRMFR